MKLYQVVYTTLKKFELEEGVRRDDFSFDTFSFFAKKLGYKSDSSVRKMCEPRSESNSTKLGLEEAAQIVATTGLDDLKVYFLKRIEELRSENKQGDLFGGHHE